MMITAQSAQVLLRSQGTGSTPNHARMVFTTPSWWYIKVQTTAFTTIGMTTGMNAAERKRFLARISRLNNTARASERTHTGTQLSTT